jgi:hypothetical protein
MNQHLTKVLAMFEWDSIGVQVTMKAICGLKFISGLSFQQMTTTTQMQQDCSARTSTRHSPSNASQAYGLQTPRDAIPAFVRHSSSKDDRLRQPKYTERRHSGLRPGFPEQRIPGLRPAYPERRNPGLRPAFPAQRNCSSYGCSGSAL